MPTHLTIKKKNHPNPTTAMLVKEGLFSGDSTWGYNLFCGQKEGSAE